MDFEGHQMMNIVRACPKIDVHHNFGNRVFLTDLNEPTCLDQPEWADLNNRPTGTYLHGPICMDRPAWTDLNDRPTRNDLNGPTYMDRLAWTDLNEPTWMGRSTWTDLHGPTWMTDLHGRTDGSNLRETNDVGEVDRSRVELLRFRHFSLFQVVGNYSIRQ